MAKLVNMIISNCLEASSNEFLANTFELKREFIPIMDIIIDTKRTKDESKLII